MPDAYKLKNFFEQGKYEQIAEIWNDADEVERFSRWDFLYCMKSLYELKRYSDCLEVYRKCHKKYPDFSNLDGKMCWAVYHVKVKDFDFSQGDKQALLKQIDYVFKHSEDGRCSPRWFMAKFVAKAIDDGQLGAERDYNLALHYLDKVNPDTLSDKERRMPDASGKNRCLSSDRESWFSYKTKFLLKQKEYEACIDCCDRALQSIDRFHSNNDCWFVYRKAKCLQAVNRPEDAKALIEGILEKRFKHWYLFQLMFEFEAAAGNESQALKYAGECALSDFEHKMRVSFYEDLASYLEAQENIEISMLLRKLVLLLRAENQWKERSHHTQWQLSDEIAVLDKQAALKRLNPIWHQWRDKDKVFLSGTINKIFSDGKSGFIFADNGGSYYFNVRDFRSKKHKIYLNMRVRFTLEERLDKSKNEMKLNAVEINAL